MRVRWVLEFAIVASWIPGRFHVVSTIEMDGKSTTAVFTEALRLGKKMEDVKQGRHYIHNSNRKI